MEFQKLIRVRRSIRGYAPDPVPDEALARVLEAARLAPTAANRQAFRIVVVTDSSTRTRFKEVYDRDWFYSAPVILVGCVEPGKCWQRSDGFNAAEVDLGIVMDHMILAAADLGLGTCWIAAFDPAAAREVLGLPPEVIPSAFTPLGIPADTAAPKKRRPLTDLVRQDHW